MFSFLQGHSRHFSALYNRSFVRLNLGANLFLFVISSEIVVWQDVLQTLKVKYIMSGLFIVIAKQAVMEQLDKQRPALPYPHRVSQRAALSTYQPLPGLEMSNFFDKATQKIRKKVGRTVDQLRPSPQQGKAASPAPLQPTTDPSTSPRDPAISISIMPPSPPTVLETTGSAVKGLLMAVRDGSDLFLPLKAALVGVVALWDIFDVLRFFPLVLKYSHCI